MRSTGLRNQTTYNMIEHRETSPIRGELQKGIIKNLREQSPYFEGERNKDWINPSLSSNVLFYNHGLEVVPNHHVKAQQVNKKGWNLNNYVAYDVQNRPDNQSTNQISVNDQIRSTDARNEKSISANQKLEQNLNTSKDQVRFQNTSEQKIRIRPNSPMISERQVHLQNK